MAISFQNQSIKFKLNEKVKIKKWLSLLVKKQNHQLGELNFVFTNDEELLKYNQNYLQHNTLTDIITFQNSESNLIQGDIIISIERVTENAKLFQVDLESELKRVLAHGVLHLLGYDDKSKKAKEEMRKQEDLALKLFEKMTI